jgi:hypothetical protein
MAAAVAMRHDLSEVSTAALSDVEEIALRWAKLIETGVIDDE